jgi:hypothetical protein
MKKHLPAFLQQPLGREIALAIAIKLVVIAAIFYAFFAGHAVDPDADSVADHLVNSQQHTTH